MHLNFRTWEKKKSHNLRGERKIGSILLEELEGIGNQIKIGRKTMKVRLLILLSAGMILLNVSISAQSEEGFPFESISLEDLSAFQSTAPNWKIVGKVSAALDKDQKVTTSAGTGILVNDPDDDDKAQLFFQNGARRPRFGI